LFSKFSDIHDGEKLEQFVRDLHSGKLHHDFHHPPQPQAAIDGPESTAKPTESGAKPQVEMLKEKVEKAEAEKNPVVPAELKKKPVVDEHDEHDDPAKPVPVKSVLKNLKPSENRYSFAGNRDEL